MSSGGLCIKIHQILGIIFVLANRQCELRFRSFSRTNRQCGHQHYIIPFSCTDFLSSSRDVWCEADTAGCKVQTETGGVMLTPLPGVWADKPGSASLPFFGVLPVVLDPATGQELLGAAEGVLAVKQAWPGILRGVHRDPSRYEQAYFSQYKGYYFTGDGVRRDGAVLHYDVLCCAVL